MPLTERQHPDLSEAEEMLLLGILNIIEKRIAGSQIGSLFWKFAKPELIARAKPILDRLDSSDD